MSTIGLQDLTNDQAVSLRIFSIDEDFYLDMLKLKFNNFYPEKLIALKILEMDEALMERGED